MKIIALTNRLAHRIMAIFDRMIVHHHGSGKFRVFANEKPFEENKWSLKISQSHW